MEKTIFTKQLDMFNEYAAFVGIPPIKLYDKVEDTDFDKAIAHYLTKDLSEDEKRTAVIHPSREQIQKIGIGAIVAVFVERVDDLPRTIRIEKVNESRYAYYTEGGMGKEDSPVHPEYPHIYYKDSDGAELSADPITGLHSMNASHIVAIYEFGVKVPEPRNYMFDAAEKQFVRSLWRYRNDMESVLSKHSRRFPKWGRYLWNDNGKFLSLRRGTFLGNLFDLAFSIIERSPTLDVHYYIDVDSFIQEYTKAGKPGWVGEYCLTYDRLWSIPDRKRPLPHGRVNVKAFRNWVLRNYKRFVPGHKQCRKEGIARSLSSEKFDYESYQRDFEYEFRRAPSSASTRDNPDFDIE